MTEHDETDYFVDTEAVKVCVSAVAIARRLRRPVHIVGKPGTGKTTALRRIADEMGATYCEVDFVSKSTKGMLEMLLFAYGDRHGYRSIRDTFDAVRHLYSPYHGIVEGVYGDHRHLVIIDEVQTLEATAFRELLRLHERIHFDLVVAGNAERLTAGNKDQSALQQIESRLSIRRELPAPSHQDCLSIGAQFNVEGKKAYEAISNYGTKSNIRQLVYLLETAKLLVADERGIRIEHLNAAIEILVSKPEATELLKPEKA